jgi:carbonic anhydrase/acetyltransferase-like protein (isoleucine patch superfamily)
MSGATLPKGLLEIDASVFLAPGAIVCGEVRIGAHSSVWFHTVIRGDTDRIEIGAHTNIQDLTMVHVDEGCPAIIGDRVTIGHRAIIHGCVIEDDCLIGMGAIVLSGARIGAGSLIGAGALVRERQVIPPGSLVLGAPGRVTAEVQPTHREAIARGATHYEALARDYRAQGFGQPIPPATGAALGGGYAR